jgi:hypothetical protein
MQRQACWPRARLEFVSESRTWAGSSWQLRRERRRYTLAWRGSRQRRVIVKPVNLNLPPAPQRAIHRARNPPRSARVPRCEPASANLSESWRTMSSAVLVPRASKRCVKATRHPTLVVLLEHHRSSAGLAATSLRGYWHPRARLAMPNRCALGVAHISPLSP